MEKDLYSELRERIKELSCLYNISKIVQQNEKSTESIINEICACVPSGWSYPEKTFVKILLDQKTYLSAPLPEKTIIQFSNIIIDGEVRGRIEVHYKKEKNISFISEEQQLIDKIATEIAVLVERNEKKIKQELLENHLRHTDRLNILGELTAGIAHELNTPMGNILGYAELLLHETKNDTFKRDLEKIITSAKHSREIIKKLMFFACEMPTQFEPHELNKVTEESLRLLHGKFEAAGINLVFEPDKNLPAFRFDTVQMTQVIFNLVLNAINAMTGGGTLTVKTIKKAQVAELLVADTGKGIPMHLQAKIYQPFFTTRPVGEGTGLGLSVVHGIVKAHNGKIQMVSTEGKGTTFTLEFPLK